MVCCFACFGCVVWVLMILSFAFVGLGDFTDLASGLRCLGLV